MWTASRERRIGRALRVQPDMFQAEVTGRQDFEALHGGRGQRYAWIGVQENQRRIVVMDAVELVIDLLPLRAIQGLSAFSGQIIDRLAIVEAPDGKGATIAGHGEADQ